MTDNEILNENLKANNKYLIEESMKVCEHEFENANCTNCANGLPTSAFECLKVCIKNQPCARDVGMTKERLLGCICPSTEIAECCLEIKDTSCEKCELELSIMLDRFAEKIRADAIDELISTLNSEEFIEYYCCSSLNQGIGEVLEDYLKEQNK